MAKIFRTIVSSCLLAIMAAAWGASEGADTARVEWLRAEISRHDELYFKKAAPEITDAEYDALKRELREREQALGLNIPAPAGDDRGGNLPVRAHKTPMLGLEKAYTRAELQAFLEKAERAAGDDGMLWAVEPKFDGLAVNLVYRDRRLVFAATRGDGREGDDVTANVLKISGIPRELPAGAPDLVEVRGEVYMDHAEFARINAARVEAGEEPFAHPRNLAAGTLKSAADDAVSGRRLSAVFYGLGAWQGESRPPVTQSALHPLLATWGLPGVERVVVVKTDDVWIAVEEFGRTRSGLRYPTDGVVIKADSRAVQAELGSGGDAPRWAVAYKYAPEKAATRLRAITLQTGRTGVVTPVAELEPVKVGGTLVSRATLHNADEISRRDLRIGDRVYVEKAGEVVPAITGVDTESRPPGAVPYEFPAACGECGTGFEKTGAVTRCPNAACKAQVKKRVEFYAARVGIAGLGPALIAKLADSGKVRGVPDLYRLGEKDGVPARVLGQIALSKHAEPAKLITGLGFAGVGEKRAAELAAKHGGLAGLARARDLDETDSALLVELLGLGVDVPEAAGPAKQDS